MIHFLYSLVAFIIALFFIMLGSLSIMVQASHDIRSEVISFILEDKLFLSLFGIALILIGSAIIFYISTGFKKKYIRIKSSGSNVYYLDENIFQDSMKKYWKQLFPSKEIPHQITLKKNKVLITADLPYVPESEQKALLTRIDKDLKELFSHFLGYSREYVVSISFQSEPSNHPVLQK